MGLEELLQALDKRVTVHVGASGDGPGFRRGRVISARTPTWHHVWWHPALATVADDRRDELRDLAAGLALLQIKAGQCPVE
jgi:hypothetical protein